MCAVAVIGAISSSVVAAEAPATLPFLFTRTMLSQCTGEPTAVALEGTVTVDRHDGPGGATYSAEAQLSGSATGELTGTRVELVGTERVELASPSGGKLTVIDHVYSAEAAAESSPLGFATATLAVNGKGRVTSVTSAFEFTCD
ncbi:MAG: hypothetical protein ACREQJ_10500 [Candidatus Binatia bacterium]